MKALASRRNARRFWKQQRYRCRRNHPYPARFGNTLGHSPAGGYRDPCSSGRFWSVQFVAEHRRGFADRAECNRHRVVVDPASEGADRCPPAPRSVGMIVAVVAMAVLLPIFGLSVAVIAAGSRLARVRAYPQADPDRKASGMFRTALLFSAPRATILPGCRSASWGKSC
jgi:hypothetical protein